MSLAQRIIIASGLFLVICGMSFGLYYALFAEHQSLVRMGSSLASGLSAAATGNMAEAMQKLAQYGDARYQYLRYVHAHSHWTSMGILLVFMGCAFRSVRFNERVTVTLALLLVYGSLAFPMGVLLAAWNIEVLGKILSITGALSLIAALAAYAWGLRSGSGSGH